MARGRSQAGVKSHRRGRRKRKVQRRLPVAPWIVITTVLALVGTAMVSGYLWLLGAGCSGEPVEAVVAAPRPIAATLQSAASEWERSEPEVDGQCVTVDVEEKSSDVVANRLANSWNTETDGKRPHIWVPESRSWLQLARLTDAGNRMIPDSPPLVATSPTVMAMPEPAAKALGWDPGSKPKKDAGKPNWSNLAKLAKESDWGDFGHEEWGDIDLGMSNPRSSTPSLHALISVVDENQDGTVGAGELDNVSELKRSVVENPGTIDDLMAKMDKESTKKKPVSYLSAFPALERDVWSYNTTANDVKLTPVSSSDGSIDADHPMAVLKNVDWTSETYREIGDQFADYLSSEDGKRALDADGYRDGSKRTGSKDLTGVSGLAPQIKEPPRAVAEPETVLNTVATWEALERPANVNVVLDTSESMGKTARYDGKKMSRIDIVRKELKSTLGMFGEQANVGLSTYSGGQYFQEVPMRPFDSGQEQETSARLTGLKTGGDGGMYTAAVESYRSLLDSYNKSEDAANLVVLISDGGDESGSELSAEDMRSQLSDMTAEDRSKDASVVTIGYGEDADAKQLQQVASATQGTYYAAKWGDQLNTQLLNALFQAS